MPAPVQVSPEQVVQAAAALVAQGKATNGWSLRGVIGKGKPERLLAVWQGQQESGQPTPAAAEPEVPVLPPAIADHLAEAVERVAADLRGLVGQAWSRAADLAARRVQEEVEEARARVVALEDEVAEAARVLDETDQAAAALADERDGAREEADAARRATAAAEQTARERAAADAARLADAERLVGELRHQVDLAEARAREASASAAKAQQDAAAAGVQAEAATAVAGEARQERDAARAEAAAARELAAAAREALARAEATAVASAERAQIADERARAADDRLAAAMSAVAAQVSRGGQDEPAPAPVGRGGKGKVPSA